MSISATIIQKQPVPATTRGKSWLGSKGDGVDLPSVANPPPPTLHQTKHSPTFPGLTPAGKEKHQESTHLLAIIYVDSYHGMAENMRFRVI